MTFSFIHGADLHLDSPLRGLSRYEGAPEEVIRLAAREALEELVRFAVEERVDFLLLSGDIWDGDWRDYSTGVFFNQQMTRLQRAGIQVFVIRGNHDAASRISKQLTFPANVYEFSTKKSETLFLEEHKVALHGQSFAHSAEERNLAVDYPSPKEGYFHIGLLHTALCGKEGHAPYAPCTLDELVSKGYDYWALGHIHQKEILHRDPWVVYPGNLQGRHIRETGEKGCLLVSVKEQEVVDVHFHSCAPVRWERVTVSHLGELEKVLAPFLEMEAELVVIRLEIQVEERGFEEAFEHEVRQQVYEQAGEKIWVEKICLLPRKEREASPLFQGELGEVQPDSQELFQILAPLSRRTEGIFMEEEGKPLGDPHLLEKLLKEGKELLMERLAGATNEN